MILYHFSEKKLRGGIVRPSRPKHGYTRDYGLALSYWYKRPRDKEYLITGDFLYKARVNEKFLLDLSKKSSLEKLAEKFNYDFSELFNYAKKLGFIGVLYKVGDVKMAVLFYPVKADLKFKN